jgi:hypothetical protein
VLVALLPVAAAARLAVFLLFVLNAGCMKHAINKLYPPLEPTANQIKSIEDSQKQLSTLQRADLYATIKKSDLQTYVLPEIEKAIPNGKDATLNLGPQRVIVSFRFDWTGNVQGIGDVRIAGRATVNADVTVSNQELVIRPSFDAIKLSTLKIRNAVGKPTAALVNALVIKPFLASINGAIEAQRMPLALAVVQPLKAADLLGGLPQAHAIVGSDATFTVTLDRGTAIVDERSVDILAKLGQGNQAIQYNTAVTPSTSSGDLSRIFNAYRTAFDLFRTDQLGQLPETYTGVTTAAIGKKYLAGLVNTTLAALNWSAGFVPPPFAPVTFEQEIRADQAPQLNCQASARSCDISWSCDQTRSCDPGWNCPDCQFYDGVCHAQRAACEIDKGRYRAQCEAEKAGARAACEANKAAAKAACEVAKTAEIGACQTNQEWLNAWSGAAFGRVRGTAEIENIHGRAGIVAVSVSDDLSQLSVRGAITALADFRASFVFTPLDAGHLLCQIPWGGDVRFQVGVPPQIVQPAAAIVPLPIAGSAPTAPLDLTYTIPAQPVTLKTSMPPVVALLEQNPQFFITCAPVASLGLAGVSFSQKLREDLIKDTFDTSIGEQKGRLKVDPVRVKLGIQDLILNPWWGDKAVGFSVPQ